VGALGGDQKLFSAQKDIERGGLSVEFGRSCETHYWRKLSGSSFSQVGGEEIAQRLGAWWRGEMCI